MTYKWHKTVRIFDFAKITFNEIILEFIIVYIEIISENIYNKY